MAYNFYTIRVSDKNEHTFNFPISEDSLEDFSSMSLSEKMAFQKELTQTTAPLEDGFIETSSHYFNPLQLVDKLYFFEDKYLEAYQDLSEYEKLVFQAYTENKAYDFQELNDNFENYTQNYQKSEFLNKIKANDEALLGLFNFLDMDDKIKARYFEKIAVEVEFGKDKNFIYFISQRDKDNYDRLPEYEQKKLIPQNTQTLAAATGIQGLALKHTKKEDSEVVRERHARVNAAIGNKNFQLFFDYFEEGQVELKHFYHNLIDNDFKQGTVVNYLMDNTVPFFKDFTDSEKISGTYDLLKYFYEYEVAHKEPKDYEEFLEGFMSYIKEQGIDIAQHPKNLTYKYFLGLDRPEGMSEEEYKKNNDFTLEESEMPLLEYSFLVSSIKDRFKYSYKLPVHEQSEVFEGTQHYGKSLLNAIHKGYGSDTAGWQKFIDTLYQNLTKDYIYRIFHCSKYNQTNGLSESTQSSIFALTLKMKSIAEFLVEKDLPAPSIAYLSQNIAEVFEQHYNGFVEATEKQLAVMTTKEPLDPNKPEETPQKRLLTEEEKKSWLEDRKVFYQKSQDYFVLSVEYLNIQPLVDKRYLSQEIVVNTTEKKAKQKI